jgi:hypothetical protein
MFCIEIFLGLETCLKVVWLGIWMVSFGRHGQDDDGDRQ